MNLAPLLYLGDMKFIALLTASVLSLTFAPSQVFASEEAELGWEHESALGIVLTGGNSDTKTLNAEQKTVYKWKKDSLSSKGGFLYGKSAGEESANNWSIGLRYDRFIAPHFTVFGGYSVDSDLFANINLRNNLDAGSKYFFWNTNKNDYAFSELGYRFTLLDPVGGLESDTQHFARSYLEYSAAITPSMRFKSWVEYLANFSQSGDHQVNFEPSLSFTIDANFSLKISYLGKYDSMPASDENVSFDYTYATSLIAKF